MNWEEKCAHLAQETVDWFWAEFSADAYFSSAPEEVPPLQDHILWFALPTDRTGVTGDGTALRQLRKAAEFLRNAAGEIGKVTHSGYLGDWEGEAAESVKLYIGSVETSCAHLENYIDALLISAEALGNRLYAIESDVVEAIDRAKRAVQEGNDIGGKVATAIANAIIAAPQGGPGAAGAAIVSSALTAEAAKAFDQTFTGDGVYATRELKEALGKLRDQSAAAIKSVGDALNVLAREVSQAKIPAKVDLPRVVQDPAFDASEFCIDDPNYSHKNISTDPLIHKKELVPGTEDEREQQRSREAEGKRYEGQRKHHKGPPGGP